MNYIIFVIIMLCAIASSNAQTHNSKVALSIGDRVPDIEYANVINYKQTSLRLSDFKDRLVILDFWSTWCTGCHAYFEKTDSLQQQFGKKVQFILVNSIDGTRDSVQKVKAFFKQWNKIHATKFRLATAIEDTVSRKYFPRRYLPHYAWIMNGKLIATTSPAEVSAKNINAIINRQPVFMTMTGNKQPDTVLQVKYDW